MKGPVDNLQQWMRDSARRFPPWSVEETGACFIVRDANGQAPEPNARDVTS
jgi:hypothetical protein